MAENRLTQVSAEVLSGGSPDARLTQVASEVLISATPDAQLTQVAVEVLQGSNPSARLTQVAVEVLLENAIPPSCQKQTLTGGRFQASDGQILSNGYLILQLSEEAKDTCFNDMIAAGINIRVGLDNLGQAAGKPKIWANDTVVPTDTYYIVNAFTNDGTQAWRVPQFWVIPSTPTPFDIGNLVPNNPPTSCCPPFAIGGNVLLLQTNGVNNGSQTKLNLVQGTGMTIADDELGNITFVATGGGGGGNAPLIVTTASSTGSPAYGATPFVVELDTTGASNITRTLPTAVGNTGAVFILKKVDSGAGIVTVAGFGGQTIDGVSNFLITNQNQYVGVVSDGSVWWIIQNN